MPAKYHYPGEELRLFEQAKNWKTYLSRKIKPFIRGKVLEVGSGISETTSYMINEKVKEWTCLEPDEAFFQTTLKKIQQGKLPGMCKARLGTLQSLPPAEMFDTIVYIDVLEHIENDREELEKAAQHLLENGQLVILSPAFPFLFNPFDQSVGHCRRYTKTSLRQVIPEVMKEKKIFYLESLGIVLLLVNKLIKKNYPSAFTVKGWDRMVIPLSRLMDTVLFHSIGKSVIGIWQKH